MPDYQFPNFQVPPGTFPFDNLPQQLQRTFAAMPTASYGRWNGTGVSQGLGYPAGINPGPPMGYPQGGGLLGGGPAPNPGPNPGTGGLLGGSLPPPAPTPGGAAAPTLGQGMPGFAPGQNQSYQQMKADVLQPLLDRRRQYAADKLASMPSLDQFKQTFYNSGLSDLERFVYWHSLPNDGAGAIDQYLRTVPGFKDWTNRMYNDAGGAGKMWDFANNRIMPQ